MKGIAGIAGAVISALVSTTALGADAPPVSATAAFPVASDTIFNWNRFYVGTIGGIWLDYPAVAFDTARTGIVVGRSIPIGEHFLVGAEATVGVYDLGAPTFEGFLIVRAGAAFSQAFIYASAAMGYDLVFGPSRMLGGGIEYALTANVTIRGDTAFWSEAGAPFSYLHFTGGFSWYIGR